MQKETLERNRRAVLERIERAERAAGRPPGSVQLVAVTKSVGPELAGLLAALGTRDLGESRLAELERKHAWLAARGQGPRWHFLGHLQRNKARRVLALADAIHSVDSLALLETIARMAHELGRLPALFLQVHLSGEETKGGFAPDDLPDALSRARALDLPLRGLMTMAPLAGSDEPRTSALPVFRALARLGLDLAGEAFEDGRPRLSMGMSGDFEVAIEAGADVVRVGGALFAGEPA